MTTIKKLPRHDRIIMTLKPYIAPAVFAIIGIGLFAFYALAYKYHFFWHEQNQIFLQSTDWLATYFSHPSWAACMAGEYLTQFFYYLWAGPAILAATITITSAMLYYALKPELPQWAAWPLTAAAWVWMVLCSMAMYYQMSTTLSITGALIIYLVLRKLGRWAIINIPLAYWAFGYGAVLLAVLIVLRGVSKGVKSATITAAMVCATAAATILVLGTKGLSHPSIGKPQMPDFKHEATLSVENEYYFGNYDRAISNALSVEEPNAVTAFYYHLAQAKKDSLPDNLLKYPIKDIGTLYTIGETTPVPVINMMNDLYYELGDMMYAERAAMMRNVFTPANRNARMIKRLAEVNLVSGDTAAALKHLRILADTHPYRDWAMRHTPGTMSDAVKAEIARRKAYINAQDTLRLGDNCRTILLELLRSNPSNTLALDYLLCTDLLLKEMDTFKADYDTYCMGFVSEPDADSDSQWQERLRTPRLRPLYQQALLIYLVGTDTPQEQWGRYNLSPQIIERFKAYNAHRGSKDFADTYWYYFDTH